ncbi:MAG: CPBP family intramembrane glutamic endopeptidase, partial [Verrucomicrobiales bacterium]
GWLLTNFFALGLQAVGFQDWLSDAMGGEGMQEIVEAFTQEDDLGVLLLLCVTAVIVAPLTEEVLFRGYLYGVAKRFCGRHAAVIFSSLIFAAIHHNAMALLPLCFLAVFLALAYEWTGSIWAPIGIHLVFNASTVAVQFALRFGWLSLPEV